MKDHRRVALVLSLLLACAPRTQQLLRDFAPGRASSFRLRAAELAAFQGRALFRGTTDSGGESLWSTDGTPAGTVQVLDDLIPGSLFAASGYVLFVAGGGTYPSNLLILGRTDGTAAGTKLLVPIARSTTWTTASVRGYVELQGRVLVALGNGEIWRTDGTASGTMRIATNLTGDPLRNELPPLVRLGDAAYYCGNGPEKLELWRTDGTTAGTRLVVDLDPVGGSGPSDLVAIGGRLYFNADDGLHGREAYASDGTAAGTVLLYDLPGASTFASRFTEWNGAVWFRAYDATHGYELWRTDGTPQGTGFALDVVPGADSPFVQQMAVGNGLLFMTSSPTSTGGARLLATDGTPAGTRTLAPLSPSGPVPDQQLVAVGTRLFFQATTAAEGTELWTTDGTPAGTRIVKDIDPGSVSSAPTRLLPFQGKLLLLATSHDARLGLVTQPWGSDGSEAGTVGLWSKRELPALGSGTSEFAELRGLAWFAAPNAQGLPALWISDGTSAGTRIAVDASSVPGFGTPLGLVPAGDRLEFAVDAPNGAALWRSDGTPGGTTKLAELGYWIRFVRNVTGVAGAHLFLTRPNDAEYRSLWRSDGTSAGTYPLYTAAAPWVSVGAEVFVLGGVHCFLVGNDPNTELWRTDGTAAGTARVISLAGDGLAARVWRGALWVVIRDQGSQRLWRSDGTAAGTLPWLEPAIPSVDSLALLAATDDALVLGVRTAATALTFWKNASGAKNGHELMQVLTVAGETVAGLLAETPRRVLVSLQDDANGAEPYVIDPAASSVRLLRDIYPGLGSGLRGFPGAIGIANGERSTRVPFAASDGVSGTELWVTDGTAAGTRLLADLDPGPGSSAPGAFTRLGSLVWFVADDGVHGREPFVMPASVLGAGGIDDLGGGCSLASASVPVLGADLATPWLGSICEVALRNAPAGQPALCVLSLVRAEVPLWTGCTVRVGVPELHWIATTSGSGSLHVSLPLPAVPALLGAAVHLQALVQEPPASVALSNALRIVVGLP